MNAIRCLMSSKLNADYIELANSYLDAIPIANAKDALEAVHGLTEMLQKRFTDTQTPIAQKLIGIQELLDNPDMYVEQEQHYQEYIELIKARIQAKIDELNNQSNKERIKRYQEQQTLKNEAAHNQTLMAAATAPALHSEAHTGMGDPFIPDAFLLEPTFDSWQDEQLDVVPVAATNTTIILWAVELIEHIDEEMHSRSMHPLAWCIWQMLRVLFLLTGLAGQTAINTHRHAQAEEPLSVEEESTDILQPIPVR